MITGRCRTRHAPPAQRQHAAVAVGRDVQRAVRVRRRCRRTGPAVRRTAACPCSGLGSTPGGAPTGRPAAMVCRRLGVQVDRDDLLGAGVDDVELPVADEDALRAAAVRRPRCRRRPGRRRTHATGARLGDQRRRRRGRRRRRPGRADRRPASRRCPDRSDSTRPVPCSTNTIVATGADRHAVELVEIGLPDSRFRRRRAGIGRPGRRRWSRRTRRRPAASGRAGSRDSPARTACRPSAASRRGARRRSRCRRRCTRCRRRRR